MSAPVGTLAIVTELEDAANLIKLQLAAGLGEDDIKETLSRHYESRICGLPSLSSAHKSKLTEAINGGPWLPAQKKLLASAVLTSGSQLKKTASTTRRANQKCHHIENLIPMSSMAKLKDTAKYSEMSRVSIISASAKSLGIFNPDETTLFRMVQILAVTDPMSTYSQRKVWDHMDTIQKFVKAGAPAKVEYVTNYEPTAELLPDDIKASAYSDEHALPSPVEWVELDTAIANHKKRGDRSAPTEPTNKAPKQRRLEDASEETTQPAPGTPLPSIELWRMSGASASTSTLGSPAAKDLASASVVCSPVVKGPTICNKCMLKVDEHGHTHKDDEEPSDKDNEEPSGEEHGLDAFEKAIVEARAKTLKGKPAAAARAVTGRLTKKPARNMKRPAGSLMVRKPVPGWSDAQRNATYPKGCPKCVDRPGCTPSCFRQRGEID